MKRLSGILVALLCCSAGMGQEFTAILSGTNEVPPNASAVVGEASFTLGAFFGRTFLGSNAFICFITVPCGEWRAGIYGPASAGAVGPRIFDFGPGHCSTNSRGNVSPSRWVRIGTQPLDSNQVAQLLSGEWYVNVSSDLFPDGELRGQLLPVDSDGDGVPDYLDQCPATPAFAPVDAEGCSIEQLCPCDGPWKNHGEYVKTYREVILHFLEESRIDEDQAVALFERAAASDCGKH